MGIVIPYLPRRDKAKKSFPPAKAGQASLTSLDSHSGRPRLIGKSSAHLLSIPYTTTEWGPLFADHSESFKDSRMEGSGGVRTILCCYY